MAMVESFVGKETKRGEKMAVWAGESGNSPGEMVRLLDGDGVYSFKVPKEAREGSVVEVKMETEKSFLYILVWKETEVGGPMVCPVSPKEVDKLREQGRISWRVVDPQLIVTSNSFG